MNRHKISMYMGVFALMCVFAMPFISNAQSARPTPEERLRMRLEPRAAAEAERIENMIARYCETYTTHHMAWDTPIPDFCDDTGTTTPPASPTLTLGLNPTSIDLGGTSTLSWSSANTTGCTASGGWSGSKATTGSTDVSPTTTTQYTLSCAGAGGTTTQSVTLPVTASTTTLALDFFASPTTTPAGGDVLLSWMSSGATSCTASDGWSGSQNLTGTTTVKPTTTTSYTLLCQNGVASISKTMTVDVTPSSTPTTTPQLLITEVYYDVATSSGSDPANEWVEIYNPSNSVFDMTGFTISDENATDTLPVGTMIPAQGHLFVVASSTTAGFWSFPVDANVVNLSGSIGNGLGNGGDSLFLKDGEANILDSLSWGDGTEAFVPAIPLPNPSDGISLRRINGFSDTDTNDGWEFGDPPTPGS